MEFWGMNPMGLGEQECLWISHVKNSNRFIPVFLHVLCNESGIILFGTLRPRDTRLSKSNLGPTSKSGQFGQQRLCHLVVMVVRLSPVTVNILSTYLKIFRDQKRWIGCWPSHFEVLWDIWGLNMIEAYGNPHRTTTCWSWWNGET